jgi:hypothetical protein
VAKTVEMPTLAVPEAVTVRPEMMAEGAQEVTAASTAQARRNPPIPPRIAWPAVRQERRRRLARTTDTGTRKVARPSTVWRGKTRI